jgi:hypothetical protein
MEITAFSRSRIAFIRVFPCNPRLTFSTGISTDSPIDSLSRRDNTWVETGKTPI